MLFWCLSLVVAALFSLAGCSSTPPEPSRYWYAGTQLDHASSGSWIERLNHYRVMAGAAPVSVNQRLSSADRAHAQYLVKNFGHGVTQGMSAHDELAGNPWYSVDGDAAAHRGSIALRKVVLETPMDAAPVEIGDGAIDEWIASPFHRLDLLDPSVTSVGWGSAREDDVSASVLEVQRASHARISWRPPRARPVMFPPPGGTIAIAAFPGGEWPDPLAACSGYSAPTGTPITIQFGARTPLRIGSHALSADGATLEHCIYHAADFPSTGEPGETAAARSALQKSGAVVMVPREPMVAGRNYAVSIEINGQRYAWTFRIAPSTPGAAPETLSAEATP
jgi:hypothetical protein